MAIRGDIKGTVRETRTIVFDVDVTPVTPSGISQDDEFVIKVNGRVVKRMLAWQAKRMGLIAEEAQF
jgi:hypothetical protein